ncbi:hypothetical protein ACTFIR_006611 [Dictyostelium discoideum]
MSFANSVDNIDQDELYIIKREDMEKVSKINTDSFKEDPYFNYQFFELSKEDKDHFIYEMEEGFMEQLIDFNECVSFDSSFKCVAMLLPPNVEWDSVKWSKFQKNQSEKLLNKGYKLTNDRIQKIEDFFGIYYEQYKAVETYYLLTLSTHIEHRKKGLASKLLNHLFKKFDKEHKRCYIECSNDANVQFYLKHGFEILSQHELPHIDGENIPDVPKITFMHRLPKSSTF